ncbi:MAG: LysR substrate-binding domain-containing protein [Cohaesibacteraceae bacterium]
MDVARSLSFAAVARERGVDPSLVSRSIQALEVETGAALFARTTRRMAFTEAGEAFQVHAAQALRSMEAATDAARESVSAPKGRVRLTASVAFGECMLVPLLVPLRRQYPEIVIDLVLRDDTVDMMAERVDLAIRLGPKLAGDLTGRRLFATRYRVCAAPTYLSAEGNLAKPDDLGDHPVVTYDLPGYRDRWRFRTTGGEEQAVPVTPALITSSALAVRRATLAGLGPALLADWLIGDAFENGELIDLFPDHHVTATDFETAVWLAYPSGATLVQKTRAVADFLIEHLALRPGI